jgi:hypothetical protein
MSKARKRPGPPPINAADYDIQEPYTWQPPNWLRDFARDHVWPFIDEHQQAAKDALYRWLDHMARTDATAGMIRQLGQGKNRLELERRPGWERKHQQLTDEIEEILARQRQGINSGNAARFASPLEMPFNRALSGDECLVALLALNDETRDHGQRVRPTDNPLFGVVCRDVHGLRNEHVPALEAMLRKAMREIAPPRGQPGRRGYSLEALAYAQKLRQENPNMKVAAIRAMCLKKFSEDDMPDTNNFARWMNRPRKRANRAN